MRTKTWILTALLVAATPALAQAATAPPPVHVRGTIVSSAGNAVVVNTGSATESIKFGRQTRLLGVVASSLDKVVAGDFIGTSVAQKPDGSIEALEVHIFPPALKGTGEGYYAWDKPPGGTPVSGSAKSRPRSMMANATVSAIRAPKSMMANATVQRVGAASGGRTVQLVYQGGTKSVSIPPDVPVVAFQVGTSSLLTPGAHVFINATRTSSGLEARVISVGEHGVVPPM